MVKQRMMNRSRRELLAAMATVGGTAFLGGAMPASVSLAQETVDPRVAKIVADTISVDMHNHVSGLSFNGIPADRKPDPDVDLSAQMKKSGLSVVCYTYAVDSYRSPQPGDWYQFHLDSLAYVDRILEKNNMRRALNLADLKSAHDRKEPVIILNTEGAHWIEGHIERVEEAFSRGMRHLQLLHQMHDLAAPLGGVQQLVMPAKQIQGSSLANVSGLTDMGAEVITECGRLGIVVDMAHANEETVHGALKIAQKPIVVSHTALDDALGRSDKLYVGDPGLVARLVSNGYAKAVADAGGIVGIWRIFPTMKDYVTAVKRMVDIVGVDHTGLGTDTAIATVPGRSGGGTNNIWPDEKVGFLYAVVGEMLSQGFHADEIAKIAGGNYCRVFDNVTAGHG